MGTGGEGQIGSFSCSSKMPEGLGRHQIGFFATGLGLGLRKIFSGNNFSFWSRFLTEGRRKFFGVF